MQLEDILKSETISLREASHNIGGVLYNDGCFRSIGKIGVITSPENLVFAASEKYFEIAEESANISCIITTKEIVDVFPKSLKGILLTKNPRALFLTMNEYLGKRGFFYNQLERKIESTAIISNRAVVSENNVFIGNNTVIEEFVVIRPNTIIGSNTIIRAGSIIGTEGYEVYEVNGRNKVAYHTGFTIIKDFVEIQANNCISRGLTTTRNTVIENEVTTDNLVHIAHGAVIGEKTRIAANAMIAGEVTIGKNVWIGPSAAISSVLKIGDNASITLGAVVTKDVPPGYQVSGNFAIEHEKFIKFIKKIR
ncbi:MAG TPA: UDP-3-O-(3-hydroxymyristoyl)glucosamine N-acyltransferase [Thermotogota bacterium]|nr:UDP-3-O-(3-hydroxymyristoyl)glucosamine N-acyltransferase [Thermotogota bacterium]